MLDWPIRPTIVYDGECPFCSSYVRLYRARRALGSLDLIDARTNAALVRKLTEAGCDLDQGFAFIHEGAVFCGDEAIHRLARSSDGAGLFNWLNHHVFRSRSLARALYPILRICRNATLHALNRRTIGDAGGVERDAP